MTQSNTLNITVNHGLISWGATFGYCHLNEHELYNVHLKADGFYQHGLLHSKLSEK